MRVRSQPPQHAVEHKKCLQWLPEVVARHRNKARLCEIRELELMRALLDLALECRMRGLALGSHSAQHQARNGGADYEHHEQNEGLVKPRPRERPAADRRPPDRESRENKRSR